MAGLMAGCGGPEQKKMKFFNRGKALYEKGDLVKAKLEFKNAIQIDPKFAEAYYMLGMVDVKGGNFQGAYGAFSKTVDLNPRHWESRMGGMKFVVVIQWVRGGNASSPIRSKPSRQVGSKPACVLVRGGTEPGAASMQAVVLSPEICIVVVSR